MVTTYAQRRRYMIDRLEGMGFRFRCYPTGAFYVFANAAHLSGDCYRLAFDILEKARVGCTPGVDFGKGGEGYLRFTYANSIENIKEGMDRLERYVEALGRAGA
jgi:aspartate/methionine/tyrosine aminotransferase